MFSLLACALLFSSLYGQVPVNEIPQTPQTPNEEHVAVGSRPMDSEMLKKIEEQKLQEAYESNVTKEPECGLQPQVRKATFQSSGTSPFRLASARAFLPQLSLANYPLSCHWLTWKSVDLRHIKIEDGSAWAIAPNDFYIVNGWRFDDPLFITPISNWFISEQYYIMNRSNNTYVKANLVDGPITFGPYSHWIQSVDPIEGHVILENQSIWCIDPQDIYILSDRRNSNEWAPNDHIIIVLHDSRFSDYDHVLINVNMDNRVRARPYN
jgi:hypothetical protein